MRKSVWGPGGRFVARVRGLGTLDIGGQIILCCKAALCTVRCLVAALASPPWMPVALTLVTTKVSPDTVTCPLGDQVPLWGNLEKKYQARLWLSSLDFPESF